MLYEIYTLWEGPFQIKQMQHGYSGSDCIVFIHFYNASNSMIVPLRSAPDHSIDTGCDGVNTPKRYRQLLVKDLPKVPAWRLECDSSLQSSGSNSPFPRLL